MSSEPRIITRAEWGAEHDRGVGPAPLPAKYLHVHHAVTRAANGPAIIRQIEQTGEQRFGRGISYTFLITPDGSIYEGHGIDREGAHTRGRNKTGRAICFVGQFHPAEKAIPATRPTAAALEACAWLVAHGHRRGWWPDQITSGHRDAPGASTACPGDWLNDQIPAINARARALLTDTPTPLEEDPLMAITEERFAALEQKVDEIHRQFTVSVPDEVDAKGKPTKAGTVRWRLTTLLERTSDLVTGKRPERKG